LQKYAGNGDDPTIGSTHTLLLSGIYKLIVA
jgi:hypothetical protein